MLFRSFLTFCIAASTQLMTATAQYEPTARVNPHGEPTPNLKYSDYEPTVANHSIHINVNEGKTDDLKMSKDTTRPPPAWITAFEMPKPKLEDVIHPHFTSDRHYLKARGDAVVAGIYVCNGPGWQNECWWAPMSSDVCMNLPDSPTLALGPDIGIQCMLFSDKNCAGRNTAGVLVTPGLTDFKNYDGLEGPPRSYKCHPCPKNNRDCGKPGIHASRWTTDPCFACHWP